MLSQQFRELGIYLESFNETQMDTLRQLACNSQIRDAFLCDLISRFVQEERLRRYKRNESIDYIQISSKPKEMLNRAASSAQSMAVAVHQQPGMLTLPETLPLRIFLEQLASRLLDCVQGPSAA